MSDLQTERPKTLIYRAASSITRGFFRFAFRIRVEGAEHIPTRGGIIIASNHRSNLDPPFIGITVTRYIRFMGKAELFQVPVFKNIIASLGAFPIHRGKIDKLAIRTAISIVQQGGCLVMFPEGHRSKTGELGPFLPGISSIAKKAGGLVVPTAIIGQYRWFQPMVIRFGQPLTTDGMDSHELLDALRAAMEKLLVENGNKS